ncbi:hypothetical protein K439DRAFT_1623819 [Ramaria rubella]|nr:hypothetical protein K439DRAFT_1623819 [Ramaria rubella]
MDGFMKVAGVHTRHGGAKRAVGMRTRHAGGQEGSGHAHKTAEGAKRATGMRRGHGGTWEGGSSAHKAQRGKEGGGGCGWVVVWDGVWDVAARRCAGVVAWCRWWRHAYVKRICVLLGHACGRRSCTYGLHCNPLRELVSLRWSSHCDTRCGEGGSVNVAQYYTPDNMYPDKMYSVCVAAFVIVCSDGGNSAVWACRGGCATCC